MRTVRGRLIPRFGGYERSSKGHKRISREAFLEKREEVPLLIPHMGAEQLTEPTCPQDRRSTSQFRSAGPDLLVLFAHALSRLGPLSVVMRQGRQHEPFLDHEVVLTVPTPEHEEAPSGVLQVSLRRASEANGHLECLMVVARQRRECCGAFHSVLARGSAPIAHAG